MKNSLAVFAVLAAAMTAAPALGEVSSRVAFTQMIKVVEKNCEVLTLMNAGLAIQREATQIACDIDYANAKPVCKAQTVLNEAFQTARDSLVGLCGQKKNLVEILKNLDD